MQKKHLSTRKYFSDLAKAFDTTSHFYNIAKKSDRLL